MFLKICKRDSAEVTDVFNKLYNEIKPDSENNSFEAIINTEMHLYNNEMLEESIRNVIKLLLDQGNKEKNQIMVKVAWYLCKIYEFEKNCNINMHSHFKQFLVKYK